MIFFRLFQPHGDFTVYWEAAWMILHGLNPYYGILSSAFPYNYPPSSFLFTLPFGLLTYWNAGILWNFLSLGALILSIFVICKIAWKKISWPLFLLFVFLFTIPYFPSKFDIGMGQINHFILLFSVLCLFFYEKNHKSLSAFFLAYAVGIKLAPIIFILYFVIKKDWTQVIRTVLYTILILLLPIIFIPGYFQEVYYTKVFFLSWTLAAKDWYYNQSLEGFLARTFSSPTAIVLSTYLLTGVILLSTWIRGLKINWKRAMAAVTSLYLLVHPIALQHYFAFALIPFILLVADMLESKASKTQWFALAFSYFLLAINIKSFDNWPRDFNFVLSHQFFGILLLWVMSLFRERISQIIIMFLVISPVIAYLINLICKAKICF